ncbi:MAG: hypothetical protein M3R24_24435 [Chloroflexota bacterium]|nr:hypothetical protein [Chloroflexota bacterium]PLS83389.1 MAG: hypothetical protein CYG59_01180 [Chloroflexota bacterium]
MRLEPYQGGAVTALELFHDFFTVERDGATIWRHLAAPIAIRARLDKEQELQEIMAQQST